MKSKAFLIAITSAIALIIIGSLLLVRAYRISNTVPVIKRPQIKMPAPNAFDYFTRAGKQLNLPKGFTSNWANYSAPQQEAILSRNQAALATLREGLTHNYMHPFVYDIGVLRPENTQFRNLAYLLRFESKVKASHGDWEGAMNSLLDGLMMGELLPRGDGVDGRSWGNGIQNICRKDAWTITDHLSSAQARSAVARLDNIFRHHHPAAESLKEAKIRNLLFFQDCFSGKIRDSDYRNFAKLPNDIKREIIIKYSDHIDKYIRAAQHPYASKPPLPKMKKVTNPFIYTIRGPIDLVVGLFCISSDSLWFSDLRCETQNKLLQTKLALHAYHLDKGIYPDKLSDLVPGYLQRLPDDPFALKGSFSYRREGSKYLLWSIGPDSKDDGGKPILNTKRISSKNFSDENSKGDIVAGVNDW